MSRLFKADSIVFFLVISLCSASALSCTAQQIDDDSDEPWTWGHKEGKTDGDAVYPKSEGSLRIVTYNVGAFGKFITSVNQNVKLVADMMNEAEADVVCLNELDSLNTRHKVNEIALLADALGGWEWYFGRAMAYRGGAYGNGVVLPKGTEIVEKYRVALPEGNEPRSIAVVETAKYVIAAAHLDTATDGIRVTQAEAVNRWVESRYRNYAKPVFLCGDMNSVPSSEAVAVLGEKWEILSSASSTILPLTEKKCIDYVFRYKGAAAVTVTSTNAMTRFLCGDVTTASDHLPVYADVKF